MRIRKTAPLALAAALVVATGFALARSNDTASAPLSTAETSAAEGAERPLAHGAEELTGGAPELGPVDENAPLPPNHPAIGGATPPASPHASSPHDAPSLAWKVDPSWKALPNPSAMRLATYGVPHATSDAKDAELSIARAGGDTDANIARWAGQFEGGPKPDRKDLTVRGIKVAVVQLEGTYAGGMGPDSGSHEGWAMFGAIVEAPGQPYFFKLTGPKATVRAAKPKFDALIASLSKP